MHYAPVTIDARRKASAYMIDHDGNKSSFLKDLPSTDYKGYPSTSKPGAVCADGKIVKIIAARENWAAIIVRTSDGHQYSASGAITNPQESAFITMEGEWQDNAKYGRQFKAKSAVVDITRMDANGVVALLSSSFVEGVGESKAKAICAHFGDRVFDVIGNHYEQLTEVPGIGKATAKKIKDSFAANQQFINLGQLLKPDVTDAQIKKFVAKYGSNAGEHIKENPYKLIEELEGIGFKKADRIAIQSLHLDMHDSRRIDAAIVCGIDEAASEGHCFVYLEDIYKYTNKLAQDSQGCGFTNDEIQKRIKEQRNNKRLVIERANGRYLMYTARTWNAENRVAATLYTMATTTLDPFKISQQEIDVGIQETEKKSLETTGTPFIFEDLQRDAVKTALTNRVSIITGGPGTGKTTCMRAILTTYLLHHDRDTILLCAPTGRAASRMREVTGVDAMTIHSAMHMRPGTDGKNLLVIADETSMNDIYVADMLLSLVSLGGRLVLIGDPDQLPSVGAGNFLNDVISSGVVPVLKLAVCYRNSGAIAKNADRINHGFGVEQFELDDEFAFISSHDDDLRGDILREYYKQVDMYGIKDTCCVCPMRKSGHGQTCTEDLNIIIRDKLNPLTPGQYVWPAIKKNGVAFREGDRVMLTKNTQMDKVSRRLVNGDLGTIEKIMKGGVLVNFDDDVTALFDRLVFENKFILAYACTVHKCQGQEYASVVIACAKEHQRMLERNLIYTAITRAKKHCTIVGEANYVRAAAQTVKGIRRNTMLAVRLQHPEWRKSGEEIAV